MKHNQLLAIQCSCARWMPNGFIICLLIFCATTGCEQEREPSVLQEWDTAIRTARETATTGSGIDKPVPSPAGPHPKAVVPKADFQFGKMRVGTHLQHEFEIRNEGEAALELVAGNATCKCTQFSVQPASIEPGESATLTVEWHGKVQTAAFSHGGPVYTNDPQQPEIRFNVGGIVDATVTTLPQGVWNAGAIPGDEAVTIQGSVYSPFLPELQIDEVTTSSEFSTVEYEPMTEKHLASEDALSGWKFRVVIRPGFPVGKLDDILNIRFANVEDLVEIPLQATRLGAIRFLPSRGTGLNAETRTLLLGQFPSSKGRTGECTLMVRSETFAEELQLLEVTASPRNLKASLERIGAPNGTFARYKLKVSVPPGSMRTERPRSAPATIRCRTNHPEEPEFVVQVTYASF